MDPLAVALLIPVAVIVMGGLTQIARELTRGRRHADLGAHDEQVEAPEQERRAVRRDSSETQERPDFAERLLARSQDPRRLGSPE